MTAVAPLSPGVTGESDRAVRAGGSHVGDDRYASRRLIDDDFNDEATLVVGEHHEFTGQRGNDQSMHTAGDTEINLLPKRPFVDRIDRISREERGLQDRQNAVKV